jgi:hypothetical protein
MAGPLKSFAFDFDREAGSLAREALEAEAFREGNSRLAVQYYLWKAEGLFFEPDELRMPKAYLDTGVFVFREEPIDFGRLQRGDILFCEPRRDRNDEPVSMTRFDFGSDEVWYQYFHTAVFLGRRDAALEAMLPQAKPFGDEYLIYHSTPVAHGSAVWPLDHFEHFYRPVSAKRVLKHEVM